MVGLMAGATAAAAALPANAVGQACLPGVGVTVVVDYSPSPDAFQTGCAIGAQPDIEAAGAAAGFTFTKNDLANPTFLTGIGNAGFVTAVLETGPSTSQPRSFWSIYINTTSGQPNGPLANELTFAATGIDGGPLAIDTVLLFDYVPDYLSDPADVPRVTYADLGAPEIPGNDTVNPPSYAASSDSDALAAAGWIGRQLEANGGVLPGAGGTDYGLTIDAIFALAAAGVGGNDIATAAQAIYQSGTAYLGAVGDSAANAGKIAKTTLALQVAGLDPTVFPDGSGSTRNLPEELRLAMLPDGAFGPNDFPLVHALAILVLDRTSGGVPAAAVTWLQDAQCKTPDPAAGGFGFSGCADVDVDGTSLATQALLAAGVPSTDPSVIAAAAWLSANQQASGALLSSFGGANTNGTGLGGQTFLVLGNSAAATSAAGFIGGLQVSCASVGNGSLLTVADVGGIAYDATGLQDANEFGIDSISVDQWRRASTQAILGLGLPAFDSITAAGADPELPAAPTCEPVVTTSPTTTVPTTATLASLTPVVATTPAGPQLVNTGVTSATLPMTMTGLVAIMIGFGLVLIARRTRGGEHG
jgi:hypothetical protein